MSPNQGFKSRPSFLGPLWHFLGLLLQLFRSFGHFFQDSPARPKKVIGLKKSVAPTRAGLATLTAGILLCGGAALNELAAQALFFEGGPPSLRISRFAAGRATSATTDASTTLVYRRATETNRQRKVVVSVVGAGGRFDLSVEATDPTHGAALAPVALRSGRAPADLLGNVPPCGQPGGGGACEGRATLRYRLRAAITDRPGQAEYTVRYTLIAQ
ncbi:hypothetical protein GGP66_002611 [Salinibacter ruber]|uniref:Uncharacterized protein n=1 Tax=Salinibacter ruber TaxID=146919 RepID=A0A9X2UP13_9BACT|nr:hypothetical protein [Salinibacter ruber]MCS3675166.1 hypothetical protein [Salinibacter ruber]MCS4038102.1 hypothetical protein [Salinibacter ruber]